MQANPSQPPASPSSNSNTWHPCRLRRYDRLFVVLTVLLLLFVAIPMRLAAQTASVIEGTVLDIQGRAIVGAAITVSVSANAPLLETAISSSGATILPQQIEQVPINGRNYLDLLQLVPGVAVKRQVDAGTDAAVPMLGERGGNAIFLIDGMPNNNAVDGGPAVIGFRKFVMKQLGNLQIINCE